MKTIEEKVRLHMGVWPFSDEFHTMYWYAIGKYYTTNPDNAEIFCSRYDFEECAKKLRNEPDWKDAPDWAVAKAQDSAGEWYWYEVVPRPNTAMFKGFPGKSKYAGDGEVIGDWRDTLKLRPEEKKMEDKNDWLKNVRDAFTKNAEEFDSLLMSVLNRIEGHERLEKSEKTAATYDWHEKGEFPPVGAEFEFSINGSSWDERVMLFNDGITCMMASRKHPSCRWHYKCDNPDMRFRPLQTERERVVKAWIEKLDDSDILNAYLGGLYDIGALKMPEDK